MAWMNSLAALTHSSIELPASPGRPGDMDELEQRLDELISLIDEALALLEERPC
jgi:hypothetical protein